jgi:hypothetical protein
MNPPTQVTERYLSNLLHYGRNKEFDIIELKRESNTVDGMNVGYFFRICVCPNDPFGDPSRAVGATISQALRRALEKHGVTFRS